MGFLRTAFAGLVFSLFLMSCGTSMTSDDSRGQFKQFETPQAFALVVGKVRDLSGRVLEGVSVQVDALIVTSNTQGYFAASRLPARERLVVRFFKQGFVPQTKVVHTRVGQSSYLEPYLAPIAQPGTFSAAAGVTASNGTAAITIPGNSLQTADGQFYAGEAKISVTPFDPTTEQGLNAFPGRFEGVSASGEVIPFRSYGFVDLTPYASDGRALQLREGASADVKIPIPPSLVASSPASIPLWFFNTRDGQWHEEGSAIKSGNVYVGRIQHFSIWNCDVGYRRAYVIGRVINCTESGQPVAGARVTIRNVKAGWTSGEDSTPESGEFRIPVNADEPVDLWAEKGGISSQHIQFTAPGPDQTYNVGDVCLGVPRMQIVLSWGAKPLDLDAHLTIPNANRSRGHVYFSAKSADDVNLDTDARNGFGPEIITVYKLHDGIYRYAVHHFAGEGLISTSQAYVHMTIEGLGIFEMHPPRSSRGKNDLWTLWDIEARNGKVTRLTARATLESAKSASDLSAFSPR